MPSSLQCERKIFGLVLGGCWKADRERWWWWWCTINGEAAAGFDKIKIKKVNKQGLLVSEGRDRTEMDE